MAAWSTVSPPLSSGLRPKLRCASSCWRVPAPASWLAADLAIAAEDAIFTLAYCHLGTSPDGGSTFFLPRHVGSKKAMEIALLGDRFDAAEALRLGLVNSVVPAAELDAGIETLAARLARGPREAYAAAKRLLNQSALVSLETQLQAEAENFAACAATPDFAEGVAAFL